MALIHSAPETPGLPFVPNCRLAAPTAAQSSRRASTRVTIVTAQANARDAQPGGYASEPISVESRPVHSTSAGTRLPITRSMTRKNA